MGRPINETIQELLDEESCETQTTLELRLQNGTVRRFATREITVGGEIFTADLLKVGEIVQSAFANVDRTNALIKNVDKTVGLEVLSGDYDKATAIVGRFYRDERNPEKTSWTELFSGEARPTEVTPTEVAIEILDDLVAAGFCVADWTMEPACPLLYKGPGCEHEGNEPPCSKTRETCRIIYRFAGMESKEDAAATPGGGGGIGTGDDGGGGGGGDCFITGTLVLSATWWRRLIYAVQMSIFGRLFFLENLLSKPIEAIRVGELVYAPDKNGKLHARRVLHKFESDTYEYLNVWFKGKTHPTGVIKTHRYRTPTGEFVSIGKIGVGGEIASRRHGRRITRRVVRIEIIRLDQPVTRHNMHVEDLMTYVANDDEVHNRKPIEILQ